MSASQITQRREETWLAAMDEGWTTARIAELAGVSARYVRRLVARARASRGETPETTPTPEPFELPRLELTDNETRGSTTASTSSGLRYSLGSDAISLDGGQTWIAASDPSTPRMPVLVSDRNGRGLRKHRLEPRPFTTPSDPPKIGGLPANSELKGGRGS